VPCHHDTARLIPPKPIGLATSGDTLPAHREIRVGSCFQVAAKGKGKGERAPSGGKGKAQARTKEAKGKLAHEPGLLLELLDNRETLWSSLNLANSRKGPLLR